MKTRIVLLSLAAGVIACLLMMQRISSPTTEKSSEPEEIATQTNTLSASNFVLARPAPPVLEQEKINSSRSEILDLTQRIQEALKTGELADHELVFTNLLLELIKKDPHSAATLAESMQPGPLREEMLRRVAQHWTEQDPASAKQWAEQLSDEHERDSALADVCFQIAQGDPRQAIQLADQKDLGKLPGGILQNLVQQWAAKDLDSAVAWVNERPAGKEKDQMLSRVAMVLAETSPAKAAQMVVDQIPAGDTQTEAVISVVYQWANRDLPGARAWVERFPEGQLRDRALNELKGVEEYPHKS